jgi:dTDP-4-dehydrorhamnose 3,5-epimerase
MRIEQTPLLDCFIVYEKVYGGLRGYFIETFNQRDFNTALGPDILFTQDNKPSSSKWY